MVSKSWGRAISGPALAVVGLVLLVMQLVITDAPTASKVLRWGSWFTLGLAAVMIFVAQYDAWKQQCEARAGAEAKLEVTIDALKGPEVWLSFQTSNMYTGFTVENRSTATDAMKVFLDPVETKSYRLESGSLPQLRFGAGPQALEVKMIRKIDSAQFMNVDLVDVLNDTCADYQCLLNLTLRYSDPRGHRSLRRVTVSANQVKLKMKFPPEIVNHQIEPDYGADESTG